MTTIGLKSQFILVLFWELNGTLKSLTRMKKIFFSPIEMKPNWYFVGLLLLVLGLIISITGIYILINPVEHKTVLHYLNSDVWWGGIMFIAGSILLIKNWKIKIGQAG